MKNNEFTTKNDFLFFQNEIIGDIKKLEIKINERFKEVTSVLETQKFLDDKKNEELKLMIENLSNKKETKVNLEPFENKLNESIKNMQHLVSKIEIKFNILNKDFDNACYRYDKAISSNLIIPGVIGIGCPFESLRNFLEYINVKIAELNKDKEKNVLDTKLYKEKLESLIKSNQMQLETMEFKMKDIFRQQLISNENLFKERITEIYNKIENDKNNNEKVINEHEKVMNEQEKLINGHEKVIHEHKSNLDKIVKDFDKFYGEDWKKQNSLVKELINSIEKNKEQIQALNDKINEIENIIKNMNSSDIHNIYNCRHTMHNENNSTEIKNSKDNSLNNSKIIQRDSNKTHDKKSQKNSVSSRNKNSIEKKILEKKLSKNINKSEGEQTSMIQENSKNDKIQLNDKMSNEFNNNENGSKSRNINKIKKKDLKRPNRQMSNDIIKVKNNIENNKAHDGMFFVSNNKMNETNFNKSFFFKVINYNNSFKEKKQLIKNKPEKSPKNKKNEGINTIDQKKPIQKNLKEFYNVQFKNLNLGPDFYENEIRFINYSKQNLSQAYLMAKARLEEQQRLKLNIISTLSSNGNLTVKSLSQNKFKFNRNYNEFRKIKQKEKEKGKSPDNNLSVNEYQFMSNTNFPFLHKERPKDLSLYINERKKMHSSCLNYNNIEQKMKEFNKDSNRTYIDYNILNESETRKTHIHKKNKLKKIEDKKIGSSDFIILEQGKTLTPNNIDNPYHHYGIFEKNSNDLSIEHESAKDNLKIKKSYLIQNFKDEYK